MVSDARHTPEPLGGIIKMHKQTLIFIENMLSLEITFIHGQADNILRESFFRFL